MPISNGETIYRYLYHNDPDAAAAHLDGLTRNAAIYCVASTMARMAVEVMDANLTKLRNREDPKRVEEATTESRKVAMMMDKLVEITMRDITPDEE